MSRRRPFDMATLKALPSRAARFEVADPTTPGLVLRVAPSGVKTFAWRRFVRGRQERVTLGKLEDFRLIEDVRAEATKLNHERGKGADPAASRRQARAEMTFAGLWKLYLDRHAKLHKRDWHGDERRYRLYLKAWARRRVSTLTRNDAIALLERITAAGHPVQANRIRGQGHKMFRWAQSTGLEVENPFAGTQRNSEDGRKRSRYLEPDELKSFWKAISTEADSETRDFLTLLLLTGVRSGSLAAARWEDFDLTRGVWQIPAEAMKAGKPLTLPLAPYVAELLLERHHSPTERAYSSLCTAHSEPPTERGAFVFPSQRAKAGHIMTLPREGWGRMLRQTGLSKLRPHDLRRTFATYALNAGIPLEIIGKALGHTPIGGVTSIYAQAGEHLVRLAVEKTVTTILRVARDENVVAFAPPAWAVGGAA